MASDTDELCERILDCGSHIAFQSDRVALSADVRAALDRRDTALSAANALIGEAADEAKRLQDRIEELEAALALPSGAVAGNYLSTSIENFVMRCEVHIGDEQAKPLPDNAVIATLCDAVRFAREHVAGVERRHAALTPPPKDKL